MQGEWITMSTMATFGGAVFTVTLIAQFLKGLIDRIVHLPTRSLVLVTAWAVLMGRRLVAADPISYEGLFLDWVNGFLVALTAMGAHGVFKDNFSWK